MAMKMGWRWYGEGNDPVTLADIKQIPGVTSIVWALHHKMPGEIWEEDEIREVVDQIHAYGFDAEVVESVTTVPPGQFSRAMAEASATSRLRLISAPESSTAPPLSTSVSKITPRSACDCSTA